MHNLYYPVYKNLENEVIDLAYKIHFDDDQLKVYSIKIAELLLRCCVEIEAISKDLYLSNGGTIEKDENDKEIHLYFDTDCLAYLELKWLLSKKNVYTSSSNFYFTKDENKTLTQLKNSNKRGTSGAKWKQAYQAVKHNRSENIKDANVENLLHAMAALYLLNIYYKNEVAKYMENITNLKDFDTSSGASLFSIDLFPTGTTDLRSDTGTVIRHAYESAVYIVKLTDEIYDKEFVNFFKRAQDHFLEESTEYEEILAKNPNYKKQETDLYSFCKETNNMDFYWKVKGFEIVSSSDVFGRFPFEIVLNKNQEIYPTRN